jgi:3-deoxy-manno-octulosonate cytidylyltransferase (CMP-KDO synthetase)
MNPVIIIPSRYASTRFPGKPLAEIAGKPMIQWVYEAAQKAGGIQSIHVATDDDRIAAVVRSFGGHAIMTSASAASGSDRIAEAAEYLGLAGDQLIINLQGDQPLIQPQTIEALIAVFKEAPNIPMATLAIKLEGEERILAPQNVKVVFDSKGGALYFSRAPIPFGRDGFHQEYYKHIGIYAYRREFLEHFRKMPEGRLEQIEKLEQLRVLEAGYPIRVVETYFESPDVDMPEDIATVEHLIS